MGTICPYCNIEVGENAIEAEDGCCPECGSIISVTSIFGDQEETSEFEGEDIDIADEDDGNFIDGDDLADDLLDDEMDFSGFDDDEDDDRY